MKRRDFITLVGGAAAGWTVAARAKGERVRRIGMLISGAESDPVFQAYLAAFRQRVQQLGWIEGSNLRLDLRFGAADLARAHRNAQELVSLGPEVIVASGAAGTRTVQALTRTVPIIFVSVGDPIASRVVSSIAHPEGNTTGITNLFPSITGKWPELLKEAAPQITRVALIFNPEFPVAEVYLASIEMAAPALAVKAVRTPVRNTTEIEHAIDTFATEPNGGLIQVGAPLVNSDRALISRLAIRHRLPMLTFDQRDVAAGGLISYGPDTADLYRSVADYVDRILRGAKPGELPVQFPTKFELVINLKTAKAIGLVIPEALVARADEVIE